LAVAPEFVLVKRFYKVEGADGNLSGGDRTHQGKGAVRLMSAMYTIQEAATPATKQ